MIQGTAFMATDSQPQMNRAGSDCLEQDRAELSRKKGVVVGPDRQMASIVRSQSWLMEAAEHQHMQLASYKSGTQRTNQEARAARTLKVQR